MNCRQGWEWVSFPLACELDFYYGRRNSKRVDSGLAKVNMPVCNSAKPNPLSALTCRRTSNGPLLRNSELTPILANQIANWEEDHGGI